MGQKIKVKNRRRRRLVRKSVLIDNFVRSGEYVYWLAHGCNYINSNIEEAHWSPIFPKIYDARSLSREQVVISVNDLLRETAETGELSVRQSVLAAWACLEPDAMLPFHDQLCALEKEGINPKEPKQNDVWLYFHDMVESASLWVAQNPQS